MKKPFLILLAVLISSFALSAQAYQILSCSIYKGIAYGAVHNLGDRDVLVTGQVAFRFFNDQGLIIGAKIGNIGYPVGAHQKINVAQAITPPDTASCDFLAPTIVER